MVASLQITSETWHSHARCATDDSVDNDVFFSEELHEITTAKNICSECPVLAPCLEGAIARREPWGVWGGQLFVNGKVLMVKRRRGRPPKVPRPEDQVPTIPVPEHLQDLLRTA
ncbi:MAG: WhiB family transcriptional regulator [Acidimicrobiales bacterium]